MCRYLRTAGITTSCGMEHIAQHKQPFGNVTINYKIIFSILILSFMTKLCMGQDSISQNGFYIPKNITECNLQLDETLLPEAKEKLKKINEDSIHHVGQIYILDEWLENDSTRLTNYLKGYLGPDWEERAFIIILAYYRHLNNQPFDIALECKKLKQKKDSLQAIRDAEYKIHLVADSIDGFYIPTDIYSCFRQLDKLLSDTIKQNIKAKKTEFDLIEYHMGIGRWIRNNWQLWGGSRLQQYFIAKNVHNPDGMSGIILLSYNKYLNNQAVDIDTIIIEQKRIAEEIKPKQGPPTVKIRHKRRNFYSKDFK